MNQRGSDFMSKFLASFATALLISTSAFAQVITVEFAPAEGDAITFAFDSEANTSTNVATGETGAYTFNAETNTICGTGADGAEVCATFETPANAEPKVGDTGGYTTNAGTSGTATIVSIQ